MSRKTGATILHARLARPLDPDAALAQSRMRCTTQRCHADPWKTSSTALLRPSCASEVTSWTPVTPRALILLRKPTQES